MLNSTINTQSILTPIRILIVSTFSDKHGGAISESLGGEALAGHLVGAFGDSVIVDHIDFQLLKSPDEALLEAVRFSPHILAISVKIGALEQLQEFMLQIADHWSPSDRPLIVLGGVVPTFAPYDLLAVYPDAIIARREGEPAIEALVDFVRGGRALSSVPGIVYNVSPGHMNETGERRLDLRKRHLPARITSRRVYDELGGMIWAEGSRGCDFNCTFCSIRELHGGGFDGGIRPESVVDDLKNLAALGIRAVSFTDDDFGGDPERTAILARLLREADLDIRFSISTRADHIWRERLNSKGERLSDAELASRNIRLREIMSDLASVGLERVFIGMESGSPTQLRRYGKQVSVEGNYRALEILSELGIDVIAGYIPIDPAMSMVELQENLSFLRRTGMYKKITNPLSVLRVQAGSPYLKLAQNRGLLGEQTKDLVFFKASFEDPGVQKIAEIADQWVEDMYVLMFGLKGEVASQTLLLGPGGQATDASKQVETALFNFRELEMEFIEAVTDAVARSANADVEDIIDSHHRKRSHYADDVVGLVELGIIGANPRLREAVTAFTGR